MSQVISIPDVGDVEFPDNMSADDISNAIQHHIIPQHQVESQNKWLEDNVPGMKSLHGFSMGVGKTLSNTVGGLVDLAGRGLQAVGAKDTGQAFINNAANARQDTERQVAPYEQSNPYATGAGQMAGYAIPYTGGAKIAGALGATGRIAQGALGGAIAGATTTPGNLQERATAGLEQGALGGAGEAIIPPVAKAVKGFAQEAGHRLTGGLIPKATDLRQPIPQGMDNLSNTKSVPAPGKVAENIGQRLGAYATSPRPFVGSIPGVGHYATIAEETLGKNVTDKIPGMRGTQPLWKQGVNAYRDVADSVRMRNAPPNAFDRLFEQEGMPSPSAGQQTASPASSPTTQFSQQLHNMNPELAPKPVSPQPLQLGWNGQQQAKPPMYVSPGGVASHDLEMANKAAFNERTGINQYPEATNPGTQNVPGNGPISPSQPAPFTQPTQVPQTPAPAAVPAMSHAEKAAKSQQILDMIRARGPQSKPAGQQIEAPGPQTGTLNVSPGGTVPQAPVQPVAPEPNINLEKPTPRVAAEMNEPKPEPKLKQNDYGGYDVVPQPSKGMMALREALEGKHGGVGNESPQLEILREKLAKEPTPDEIDQIASQGLSEPVKPTVMRTPEEWKQLHQKALFDDTDSINKVDLRLQQLKQSQYENYIQAQEEAKKRASDLIKKTPQEKAKWQAERDAEIKAQKEAVEQEERIHKNRSQGQIIRKKNEYAIKDLVKANVTSKDNQVIVKNAHLFDEAAKENGNTIDWADMPELTHKSIKSVAQQRRTMEQWLYSQVKQGKGNLTAKEKLSLFND